MLNPPGLSGEPRSPLLSYIAPSLLEEEELIWLFSSVILLLLYHAFRKAYGVTPKDVRRGVGLIEN